VEKQLGAVPPPASAAGKAAAGLFGVVAEFQSCLAAGAPWGAAAYGGANGGVIPVSLRRASGVAAVIYLALAVVSGTNVASPVVRRRVLYAATPVMVVGAVANVASRSLIERMLWTPVTVALAILLWRAARHPSLASDAAGSDDLAS
jgi:hypothetical protein